LKQPGQSGNAIHDFSPVSGRCSFSCISWFDRFAFLGSASPPRRIPLESHRGGPGNLARPGGLGIVDPRAAEYTRLYEEIIRRVQASPVQSVVGELAPWR
jgi:hypothetical protein